MQMNNWHRDAIRVFVFAFAIMGLIAGCKKIQPVSKAENIKEIEVSPVGGQTGPQLAGIEAAGYVIGDPISYKNLSIFPIARKQGITDDNKYLTLDEGIQSGKVVIVEKSRSESGRAENEQQRMMGNEEPPLNRMNENPSEENQTPNQLNILPENQTNTQEQTPQTAEPQVQQMNAQYNNEMVQQVQQGDYGPGDSVNALVIRNDSDQPLFLMAGEVIKGGKQNRMVQRDTIIPAHSGEVSLGVFCVEAHRWTHETESFASAEVVSDSALRKTAQKSKDQGQVWEQVDAVNQARGVEAENSDYTEQFEAGKGGEAINAYVDALKGKFADKPDVVGIVVAAGDRIIAADLFANHDLYTRLETKLFTGYAVDAASKKSDTPSTIAAADVAKFISDSKNTSREVKTDYTSENMAGIYINSETTEGFETKVKAADGAEYNIHENFYNK